MLLFVAMFIAMFVAGLVLTGLLAAVFAASFVLVATLTIFMTMLFVALRFVESSDIIAQNIAECAVFTFVDAVFRKIVHFDAATIQFDDLPSAVGADGLRIAEGIFGSRVGDFLFNKSHLI